MVYSLSEGPHPNVPQSKLSVHSPSWFPRPVAPAHRMSAQGISLNPTAKSFNPAKNSSMENALTKNDQMTDNHSIGHRGSGNGECTRPTRYLETSELDQGVASVDHVMPIHSDVSGSTDLALSTSHPPPAVLSWASVVKAGLHKTNAAIVITAGITQNGNMHSTSRTSDTEPNPSGQEVNLGVVPSLNADACPFYGSFRTAARIAKVQDLSVEPERRASWAKKNSAGGRKSSLDPKAKSFRFDSAVERQSHLFSRRDVCDANLDPHENTLVSHGMTHVDAAAEPSFNVNAIPFFSNTAPTFCENAPFDKHDLGHKPSVFGTHPVTSFTTPLNPLSKPFYLKQSHNSSSGFSTNGDVFCELGENISANQAYSSPSGHVYSPLPTSFEQMQYHNVHAEQLWNTPSEASLFETQQHSFYHASSQAKMNAAATAGQRLRTLSTSALAQRYGTRCFIIESEDDWTHTVAFHFGQMREMFRNEYLHNYHAEAVAPECEGGVFPRTASSSPTPMCDSILRPQAPHSTDGRSASAGIIPIVGLDTEWFADGPIAVVQIASAKYCFVFHLSNYQPAGERQLPDEVIDLLEDPFVLVAGAAIGGDATRLADEMGIHVTSMVDVQHFAFFFDLCGAENIALATLLHMVVGEHIAKDEQISRSNWDSAGLLTPAQQEYAIDDAIASFLLGNHLVKLGVLEARFQKLAPLCRGIGCVACGAGATRLPPISAELSREGSSSRVPLDFNNIALDRIGHRLAPHSPTLTSSQAICTEDSDVMPLYPYTCWLRRISAVAQATFERGVYRYWEAQREQRRIRQGKDV